MAHAVEWVNGLGGGTLEDTHPLRQKEGGATPCTLGGGGTLHTSTAALCRRHQISRLTKHYKKNYSYSLFIRHILLSKVCSRFISVIRFIMFINISSLYYILTAADGALVEVADRTLADTDVVKDYHWSGTFQTDCVFSVFCLLTSQTSRLTFYKEVKLKICNLYW